MKKILMILLPIMCATMAMGQNTATDVKPVYPAEHDLFTKSIRPQSAGDELHSAGKLLIISTCVAIGGGSLFYYRTTAPYYKLQSGIWSLLPAWAILGSTGIAALVLQIVGYTKLMKAGERFYFGPTSAGVGMTINLNK